MPLGEPGELTAAANAEAGQVTSLSPKEVAAQVDWSRVPLDFGPVTRDGRYLDAFDFIPPHR